MRLIDADALKAYIDAQKGRPWIGCTIGEALKIMTDEQPTIEPQRKKGEWVPAKDGYDGHVKCTGCFKIYDWTSQAQYYDFCPYCGAKME